MDAALTVAGVVVLLVGLKDMFHTLLHPRGMGRLAGWVLAGTWALSRASGHRLGGTVGPAAMVAVILVWVVSQVTGWALIYLPHVPQGFTYSSGVDPADYPEVMEAIYLSAVTLTTLGYGDVVPTNPWIRMLSPLEALTGFALLTAGLTWFSQIYPPLSRRRALALRLKGLADSSSAETLAQGDRCVVTRTLDSLETDVARVRVDFAQHSEGFYFQESDTDLSLAHHVSYLLRLRDAAREAPDDAVRRSGERLTVSIQQLSDVLDTNFIRRGEGVAEVFAGYAAQHGHEA